MMAITIGLLLAGIGALLYVKRKSIEVIYNQVRIRVRESFFATKHNTTEATKFLKNSYKITYCLTYDIERLADFNRQNLLGKPILETQL